MAELDPITTEVSSDVPLFHILPRLPVKSLFRFTCVSKKWNSFLKTPVFRKMHRHRVICNDHQFHQKILFLPDAQPWEFRTINCETPKDGFTASRPLPFKVGADRKVSVMTSLHGMVSVGVTKPGTFDDYSDLILWNPVTGDYKTLSKVGSHNDCYTVDEDQFGFFYNSSEDDYKLVCVTGRIIPDAYIYSLKSDSWKKMVSSVLLNEEDPSFLHKWFEIEQLLAQKSYSIYAKTEKLRDTTTPSMEYQRTDWMGFMKTIELWRQDGSSGEWNKVVTKEKEHWYHDDQLLYVMRNGNRLMHPTWEDYVYELDPNKHTKHFIGSITIGFKPAGKYIETMSLNRWAISYYDEFDMHPLSIPFQEGTKINK
ncbi:hypothetical protein LXL04_017724 [Taraxacum kok-saghyz]